MGIWNTAKVDEQSHNYLIFFLFAIFIHLFCTSIVNIIFFFILLQLLARLQKRSCPINAHLFIAKLIINRPAVFEAYANKFFRALMQVTSHSLFSLSLLKRFFSSSLLSISLLMSFPPFPFLIHCCHFIFCCISSGEGGHTRQ